MEARQITILDAVEKIYEVANDSKLRIECFKDVEKELNYLGDYFKTDKIQSIFISTIFSQSCFEDTNLSNIIRYFDVEEIKFFKYHNELQELFDRKIIERKENSRRSRDDYWFNRNLMNYIQQNKPIPIELISKEKNITILSALTKINEVLKEKDDRERRIYQVEDELKYVSSYFDTNQIQSIFIALSCFDDVEIRQFDFFYTYQKDIQELVDRKIVDREDARHRHSQDTYSFNPELMEYVSNNEQIPTELIIKRIKEHTFHQFLADFLELKKQKADEKIKDQIPFIKKFHKIIAEYKDFKLVNFISENITQGENVYNINAYVFVDVICDVIKSCDNDYNSDLQRTVDDLTFSERDKFSFVSEFLAGKTLLNKLKVVEKNKNSFGNHHNLRLTEKAVKMLKEWEGISFEIVEDKNQKLLYPNKIQPIELFYNPSEKTQLETVMNCLSNSAFQKMQKRLQANNMPVGIATLLYGAPGTGKTETVYQLAKKYKRPVFKVEISETKSMWFGESQKLIKKIFTDYKELKQSEKVCPILLFNEADAVIGKRKNAGSSAVADTENAIQNILLEELENFDGILFATSNLVGNIDSAFERRFLFKIKFDAPTTENAAHIWKSKLPAISTNEAKYLAQNFSFSGGEMENIARKCIMEEVISSKKSTFEDVIRFCENEKWSEGNKVIGF